MKLEYCRQIFEKNFQVPNFMEICPVGAELFHADGRTDTQTDGRTDTQTDGRTDTQTDGRTDMTKLTVVFCNSANAPNNKLLISDVPNLCVIYSSDE